MSVKRNTRKVGSRRPRRSTKASVIADRLRELIGGGSARQFALQCGFDGARLSEWLSGRSAPGAENLRRIGATTGCSIDWLLGLSDERFPDQGRSDSDLAADVAAHVRRAVARSTRLNARMLEVDGAGALADLIAREVEAFEAERAWTSAFAAVIVREFQDLPVEKRPRLETAEWVAFRRSVVKQHRPLFGKGRPPSSGNVSIKYSRK